MDVEDASAWEKEVVELVQRCERMTKGILREVEFLNA